MSKMLVPEGRIITKRAVEPGENGTSKLVQSQSKSIQSLLVKVLMKRTLSFSHLTPKMSRNVNVELFHISRRS